MKRFTHFAILIATLAAVAITGTKNAAAQNNLQRGATLGGLGGAVIGGLIGDNSNKAGEGAAIGGVVGVVAGSLLGNAADKDAALRSQQRYYAQQQHQIAQQQQAAAIQQSAVTLNDVVNMTRSGLSDSLIINQIHQRGYLGQKLAVNDIIALHQNGVSENIISSLQNAPSPQIAQTHVVETHPVVAAPVVVRQPVVVQQPVVVSKPVVRRYVPAPVVVRPSSSRGYRSSPRGNYNRGSRGVKSGISIRF